MKYDEFVENVRREAGLETSGEAARVVQATLATLGERLDKAARDSLADQLTTQLRHHLESAGNRPRWFGLEEFYNRIQARADLGHPEAIRRSRCVISVLDRASGGKANRLISGLSEDFRDLLRVPPSAFSPARGSSEFEREAR